MEKIIKPFNLEAAKKGAKVETRSGYKVTLTEERKPTYPVCGTFPYQGETRSGQWKENGEWDNNPDLDLVIVEYEGEEAPELGGIMAEPELATGLAAGLQHETKANSDDYSIELVDCDNGIFCKVHDFNPDAEDAFLVYKHEEQEQMFGKFLLDSIRAKMNCDLCSKARIDIKITTIED